MRTCDYLTDAGVDFSDVDERVARLMDRSASWLDADGARRTRLGLHELLVNIRRHAYLDEAGPISVSMTASASGVTVLVTDWGRGLPELPRGATPRVSTRGGYGLGIIRSVFDEVHYRRMSGRNEWILVVHAADPARR